jgi:hypothetical protein
MTNIETGFRQPGVARAFIEKTLAKGRVGFSLDELIEGTGLSPTAAKSQLLRLDGWTVRVARMQRYFLIVSPEHRAFGGPPVGWWLDDYFGWLGRPYYLALQSAAATYGSEPQALQITQVMTDSPRREIKIGRQRVHFFVKRRIERTSTALPTNAFAPLRVSTPEATAFDLIRYESRIGGIGGVIETLAPLLPLMRPGELSRVLNAEDEPTIAQRMGYIFERLGASRLADTIRQSLPRSLALVPLSSPRAYPGGDGESKQWRVLDNSGEFDA